MWPFKRKEYRCDRCATLMDRPFPFAFNDEPGNSEVHSTPIERVCAHCLEMAFADRFKELPGDHLVIQPIEDWDAYYGEPFEAMFQLGFEAVEIDALRSMLQTASACVECGDEDGRFGLVDHSVYLNPKNGGFDGFCVANEPPKQHCGGCIANVVAAALAGQNENMNLVLFPREGDSLFMSWEA
jgi:hypothetical protein